MRGFAAKAPILVLIEADPVFLVALSVIIAKWAWRYLDENKVELEFNLQKFEYTTTDLSIV